MRRCDLRDDLPCPRDVGDDRRSIGGTIALPRPLRGAARHVQSEQRAVADAPGVNEHEVADDGRRHRDAEVRGGGRKLFLEVPAPQQPSVLSLPGGEDAPDTKREEPAAVVNRRRLRTLAVRRRGGIHLIGRVVRGTPDLFSSRQIACGHRLLLACPREKVDATCRNDGRRMARASLNLPDLLRPIGPCRGRREADRRPGARRTAPLGPVLGEGEGCAENETEQCRTDVEAPFLIHARARHNGSCSSCGFRL